jgi:two-component system KDP operon response regulator KdpE
MIMNATVDFNVISLKQNLPYAHGEIGLSPVPKKSGAKILVVDDEPEVVKALTMRLKSAGYEVITACDGATATQTAISTQPDLVILDIGMPCGDGHVVAKRLSNNVNTLFVPVIFLTARSSQIDRNQAMDAGAFDYITKPYTSDRLLTSVERALSRTGDEQFSEDMPAD